MKLRLNDAPQSDLLDGATCRLASLDGAPTRHVDLAIAAFRKAHDLPTEYVEAARTSLVDQTGIRKGVIASRILRDHECGHACIERGDFRHAVSPPLADWLTDVSPQVEDEVTRTKAARELEQANQTDIARALLEPTSPEIKGTPGDVDFRRDVARLVEADRSLATSDWQMVFRELEGAYGEVDL